MNDTLKTSSPMFYVKQMFNTDGLDSNDSRYHFKLDLNFISCNSLYKTLALRSVEMKTKRYVVNYAVELKITPPASTTSIDPTNQPKFEYTDIKTRYWHNVNIVAGVEAKTYDENQKIYTVYYE